MADAIASYEADLGIEMPDGALSLSGFVHPFWLFFRNAEQETAYRQHSRRQTGMRKRVASGAYVTIILHLVMAIVEWQADITAGAEVQLGLCRLALVLLAVLFVGFTRTSVFIDYFDLSLSCFYLCQGMLLLVMYGVGTSKATGVDSTDISFYQYYSGRWALPYSLQYISVSLCVSALRFPLAVAVVWGHIVLVVLLDGLRGEQHDYIQIWFLPVMAVLCMSAAHALERRMREEFVMCCNITLDRKRCDQLLDSMLPAYVISDLKAGIEAPVKSYSDVTILFCYVDGFSALCEAMTAVEVTSFLSSLFTSFDRATDAQGVYKVEAIAETYMCVAGCPRADPLHARRIANMAVMMMRIAQSPRYQLVEGRPLTLKIGIHSGPIMAGVIGLKTYSYHLFGDTVNTTSRMCSSSEPGRIQLSPSAYDRLQQSDSLSKFTVIERGQIKVKGKGLMTTHFLEKKHAVPLNRTRTARASIFERAVQEEADFEHVSQSVDQSVLNTEAYHNTLEFVDPDIESAFVTVYATKRLPYLRLVFGGCAAALVFALLWIDLQSDEYTEQRLLIRGVSTVIALLVVAVSYHPDVVPFIDVVSGVACALLLLSLNLFLLLSGPLHCPTGPSAAPSTARSTGPSAAPSTESVAGETWHLLDINIIGQSVIALLMGLRLRAVWAVTAFSLVSYILLLAIDSGDRTSTEVVTFGACIVIVAVVNVIAARRRELSLRQDFILAELLAVERLKTEQLLANTLPEARHARALIEGERVVDRLDNVCMLYSDIVGFTPLSATLTPAELCSLLNRIYSSFDSHLDVAGVYKVDTIGDAFVVVGGMPTFESEHDAASSVTYFALKMLQEIEAVQKELQVDVNMRIGIHSGTVVGAVVGEKKPRYLIWGSDTIIANTLESSGTPGAVQVSEAAMQGLRRDGAVLAHETCQELHVQGQTIDTVLLGPVDCPEQQEFLRRFEDGRRETAAALEEVSLSDPGISGPLPPGSVRHHSGGAVAQSLWRKKSGGEALNSSPSSSAAPTIDTRKGRSKSGAILPREGPAGRAAVGDRRARQLTAKEATRAVLLHEEKL